MQCNPRGGKMRKIWKWSIYFPNMSFSIPESTSDVAPPSSSSEDIILLDFWPTGMMHMVQMQWTQDVDEYANRLLCIKQINELMCTSRLENQGKHTTTPFNTQMRYVHILLWAYLFKAHRSSQHGWRHRSISLGCWGCHCTSLFRWTRSSSPLLYHVSRSPTLLHQGRHSPLFLWIKGHSPLWPRQGCHSPLWLVQDIAPPLALWRTLLHPLILWLKSLGSQALHWSSLLPCSCQNYITLQPLHLFT